MTTLNYQAFGLEIKTSYPVPALDKFDLSIGEPKLSPFPFDVLDSLKNVKNINHYYPSHGDSTLRKMIISKYYPAFTEDNIAITHGAIGALDFIFRANLNSESEILIPDPGFPPYTKLAEFTGAKIKKYMINLNSDAFTTIDWQQVETLISAKTKLILINSPHNPTGKVLSADDFRCFQEILEKFPHISFILDEVYRELIYSEMSHYDFSQFISRGFVIGSFSKMYPSQGARIGWVLTSPEKMKSLTPFFNNATGSMSSFGQEIVKSLLAKKISFKENYINALANAKQILDFYNVDYVIPEGAFFIFINYEIKGTDAASQLAKLGVDVIPGIAFGESGIHYVRASFAQENETLQNGFSIIAKHWNSIHSRVLQ